MSPVVFSGSPITISAALSARSDVELCGITIQSLCQNPWIKRRSQVNNFYEMLAFKKDKIVPKYTSRDLHFNKVTCLCVICHVAATIEIVLAFGMIPMRSLGQNG